MADSLLIRGARILDPANGTDREGDLLLEKGRISTIDKPGAIPAGSAAQTIEGKGKWALPGLIDVHVHFREPGQEYKETIETGARASVSGGFTSVACMANTNPVNDNPYVTSFIMQKAREAGLCRIFPIGAVSKGLQGEELAEIGGMVENGARAISDDGMPVMDSYLMRKAMDYAKAFGVPVITHSEDACLRGKGVMNEGPLSSELGLRGNPDTAEEIMIFREIALARLTGCPVHIAHITTRLGMEQVRRAKEEGLPVTAEVCPHHLALTDEAIRGYDTNFKMAPPLRAETDRQSLIEGLAEGVIDMIATDHAPHGFVDKAVEFDHAACGVIGVESAVPVTLKLVHEGKVPLHRWVESLTVAPARLLGVEAGTLSPGAPADITLIDPDQEWVLGESDLHGKSRNCPFLGWKLQGRAVRTIVGGRVVYGTD